MSRQFPSALFFGFPYLPGIPHLIFFSPFSQFNDQKELSIMKKKSSNRICPHCKTPTQEQKIMEICTKVPSDASTPAKLLAHCIKADVVHRYQQTQQGEDPCSNCSYNQVIIESGSFLYMKEITPPVFIEVHRCQSCHQTYELKF